MMEGLRYGICSTSSIAPRFIAAVREGKAGEITAVSSRTLEKAREKATEWNIPYAYGSHVELFRDKNVNTVYVSSVNSEHYGMVKTALEYGKNVVCEKPCTVSSEQTEELFRIAGEKGLFLVEAQKMLFLPVINEVAKRIKEGFIGDVKFVDFSHSFSAGYNDWLFDPALGGGTLLSAGIYAIQFLISFFGDIKNVKGVCVNDEGLAEKGYVISGVTENGVMFCAKNSTDTAFENKAVIYGTSGKIEIPEYWKARQAFILVDGREKEEIKYPCKYELIYEAKHIAECIEKGLTESPVVTKEISLKGIRAIERIKSAWE